MDFEIVGQIKVSLSR